ncbi:hypothetical protein P3L10_010090 [Capsicum annuum]|uniref:uncharacterized protein LOC107863669 n=1 Tax=Capsicum annuum TaxID=4072 RepID=UPI0007BF0507|nr:uncharacterized protein LOC107863669 [Capsicum annuum]
MYQKIQLHLGWFLNLLQLSSSELWHSKLIHLEYPLTSSGDEFSASIICLFLLLPSFCRSRYEYATHIIDSSSIWSIFEVVDVLCFKSWPTTSSYLFHVLFKIQI